MSRVHLFEFGDQKWFPSFLRNYSTDFLSFLANKTKMYQPVIPLIKDTLKNAETNQIVDLCSGGGGGLQWLNQELKKDIPNLKILLTDKFPNLSAFNYTMAQSSNFESIEKSIDATNVPVQLKGVRTIFLAFHHFKEETAIKILEDAIESEQSIMIFEAQERSIPSILAMLFSPITVLLTTPFIRPFQLARILFTYLIPILPLITLWDGVVSSLRTYSVKEMNYLIDSANGSEDYQWSAERVKSGPGAILYLVGSKK